MYGLSVATPPAEEPVTLAEAKTHLRVEHTSDDTYITNLIKAARICIEEELRRALITQTLKLSLDCFPGAIDALFDGVYTGSSDPIRLPRNPVQSISSVQHIDTAGALQTLDASKYRLDKESLVARVSPAYGETWPSTRPITNAVTVTFVAGYGVAAAVPEPIKQALKLVLGTYYDVSRETASLGDQVHQVPQAAGYLLGPFKILSSAGGV